MTRSTNIAIYFYSNSFSYTDGTNRYYWFGDSDNVTTKHIIYLYVIDQIIIPREDNALVDEIDLYDDHLEYSSHDYFGTSLVYDRTNGLYYKSITLSLYVTGVSCSTPTATLNLKNTLNGTAYLMNLQGVDNCTGGQLMADATINLQSH